MESYKCDHCLTHYDGVPYNKSIAGADKDIFAGIFSAKYPIFPTRAGNGTGTKKYHLQVQVFGEDKTSVPDLCQNCFWSIVNNSREQHLEEKRNVR